MWYRGKTFAGTGIKFFLLKYFFIKENVIKLCSLGSGPCFGALMLVLIGWTMQAYAQQTGTISKALDFAAAKALRIENLSARLSIETVSEPGIRLNLTGSKRQIESILADDTGDAVLIIKADPKADGTETRAISGSVSVAVGEGATARIIINDGDQSQVITGSPEPVLQVTVALGAAVPIAVSGFRGSAHIAARRAPLEFELVSGDARFAAAADASLSISGSGEIAVDRAAGNLALAVRGAGDITVKEAVLAELRVTIFGAGAVQVHGQAEQADLALNGTGGIYVEAVKRKPRRRLLGAGRIIIDNW